MNLTKSYITDTFWQLLEEKPYNKITVQDIVNRCQVNRNTFYYHFHDIPSLAQSSIEEWADAAIKSKGVFGSPIHCLTYMAKECTKRKKALLHLYNSTQKESLLNHINALGYHIIKSYLDNTAEHLTLPKEDKEILIRYYKCSFIGILLDWLDADCSYDLAETFTRLCDLFAGSSENVLLKCAISPDKN